MSTVLINSNLFDYLPKKADKLTFDKVHAVITDPPYLFGGKDTSKALMGKSWDKADDPVKWHRKWLRRVWPVLLPGGFIAASSAGRTYHWLAQAAEAEGYFVHSMLTWVRTDTMPKAMNFAKAVKRTGMKDDELLPWEGYKYGGQALKPAAEPILLAQKPFDGIARDSIKRHDGAGLINVRATAAANGSYPADWLMVGKDINALLAKYGRWAGAFYVKEEEEYFDHWQVMPTTSAKERDLGLASLQKKVAGGMAGRADGSLDGHITLRRNTSVAVKPLALMRWLVRLLVPPQRWVLDPFGGSGTTACAAIYEDRKCLLIEELKEIYDIAVKRTEYHTKTRPLF